MTLFPRLILFAVAPVLGLVTVGCSGGGGRDAGKVVVQGKLLENGLPFAMDPAKLKLPPGASALPPGAGGGSLQVEFIPAGGGERIPATTNAQAGTFEVTGTDGKGIKPGRYKIAVQAAATFGAPDYFNGKFAPDRTPIVRDVSAGEEVVIDVAKP